MSPTLFQKIHKITLKIVHLTLMIIKIIYFIVKIVKNNSYLIKGNVLLLVTLSNTVAPTAMIQKPNLPNAHLVPQITLIFKFL